MLAKAYVFIATSVDGFIAREDGSIDWLEEANLSVPTGEDFGYHAFLEQSNVLVMGRSTFELVLTFEPWPYGEKRVVVLTRKGVNIPDAIAKTVSATSETPSMLMDRLSREGVKRMYVDGGLTIQSFLAAGLIEEMTITTIPVLLGKGKPLFGSLAEDVKLEHLKTQAYDCGFVQTTYRVLRDVQDRGEAK